MYAKQWLNNIGFKIKEIFSRRKIFQAYSLQLSI